MKKTLFALLVSTVGAVAAPFEIKDGDRVLLLGDALLERENTYGDLELRMHEQFPQAHFTVRNLSWSGETPKGWSRASFDPPAAGWQRLKEQITSVRPTVVFLGFGMAASLQEITDRSGDMSLNPDPVRYGAEPMTAARFKKELAELMDAIDQVGNAPEQPRVRYVLLAPVHHEDLRKTRPGLPDPAPHNALLEQYAKAIEELAGERKATYCPADPKTGIQTLAPWNATDNGISLTAQGYSAWALDLSRKLEWGAGWEDGRVLPLRAAIHRKNDLFFFQFRPANSTYLFGFRKHEQGQNAAEMPKFTPLIEAEDKIIDEIKHATTAPAKPAAPTASAPAEKIPAPTFSLADGLELTLWADTELIGKPVGMNWDAAGRLWVACSPVYPMITPGGNPDDKVVVIEDTDHDGKADKTTTFASNLLIAQGVAPDFSSKGSPSAAYASASTELLRLEDTTGNGQADQRRVVFSGFGTEDTHHTIHTLRWGPDGRLYFNQSIYIHSHVETPWGMVRLNSGGIFAYDPRTERLEVTARGFINTWGHAWDQWGQEFATDGAGFEGLHWLIPGAMYRTYEGARRILPSISPGSYPKYCSLELIQSPLFPADWQGDAITCDFRAHRVVRFKIEDLGTKKEGDKSPVLSGYITKELQPPITTTDATFRPIDVKFGPDGALYIADWTNPIINHGEVDFRDPRRDHVHGRIWRLAPKGSTPLKWESLVGKSTAELFALVASRYADAVRPIHLPNGGLSTHQPPNVWAAESARRVLITRPTELRKELEDLLHTGIGGSPDVMKAAGEFNLALGPALPPTATTLETAVMATTVARMEGNTSGQDIAQTVHQAGETFVRLLQETPAGDSRNSVQHNALTFLGAFAKSKSPRVRVEAMRALARISTVESAALVLEAALNVPGGEAPKNIKSEDKATSQFNQPTFADTTDPYYGYAAWLSVNDLAPQVMEWVEKSAAGTVLITPDKAAIRKALAALSKPDLQKRRDDAVAGLKIDQERHEIEQKLAKVQAEIATYTKAGKNPPDELDIREGSLKYDVAHSNPPASVAELRATVEIAAELLGEPAPAASKTPDLATVVTTVGAPTNRDAMIAYALQALRPEQTGPLLAKIIAKNGVPLDGSGPWIELIGQAGGPVEARVLLNGLLANTIPDGENMEHLADRKFAFTTKDANRRAAAALIVAAKRGVKPVNPPYGGWEFYLYGPDEAINDIIRLAGLWKENFPSPLVAHIGTSDAARLDAVFESLRTLGTDQAANYLAVFLNPALRKTMDDPFLGDAIEHNNADLRRRALGALAAFRPDVAMAGLRGVLEQSPGETAIPLWRDLFGSEKFTALFLKKTPTISKEQALPALRAARELGKKGDKLIAALTPIAGEAAAPANPADFAWLADFTKKNGNAANGELVYRRAAVACTVCHAIGGAGGHVGPDLTTIGASAPLDYLVESVMVPGAKVKEGFNAIALTLKGNRAASGVLARETDRDLILRDATGAEQVIAKSDVTARENIGSLMPPGLIVGLTDRDKGDLFAFLSQLGKPGPFDATKGNVARTWEIFDQSEIEPVITSAAKAGSTVAKSAYHAFPLVDGRLPKAQLEEALQLVPNPGDTILVLARFTAASASKSRLSLQGATKAWLDGAPLAIASDPNPVIDLAAGNHTLAIKLDLKSLPETLRAECADVRFLNE